MALHRKKHEYSKFIVFFCILTIILFTVSCFFFYWFEKDVDPVLIGFFFACFGMEFGSLAFIRRSEYRWGHGDKLGYVERVNEEDKNDGEANK